jgi:subtilisin family serine protease
MRLASDDRPRIPQNAQQTPPSPLTAPAAASILPLFMPDQVLVTVDPTSDDAVDQQVAEAYGLEILSRSALDLLSSRLVLYRIPDGRTVGTVVAMLAGDSRVGAPQPNYLYQQQEGSQSRAELSEADELQYAIAKLRLRSAHSVASGRGILVAVIDSEIDSTHPDLEGAVAENFDATEEKSGKPGDHGTAIAGIIRAGGILEGVAPDAQILGVNALSPVGVRGLMAATTASLLRGMDWAIGRQARVINLSVAGPGDDLLERGVATAAGNGAIIVAAAGNGGANAPSAYPAAYPEVIAATATDIGDRLYAEANQGAYVEIAAPGVDVLAPSLDHAHLLQSGTSFAAAHISGIVALMLERNPEMTLNEVRAWLMGAARDLGTPGRDDLYGAGVANAFASLSRMRVSEATR